MIHWLAYLQSSVEVRTQPVLGSVRRVFVVYFLWPCIAVLNQELFSMWIRYAQWILSSPKCTPSSRFQLLQQFRTQVSPNAAGRKPRRSIKNFDQADALNVQPPAGFQTSRLLIRPTLFTLGVSKDSSNGRMISPVKDSSILHLHCSSSVVHL